MDCLYELVSGLAQSHLEIGLYLCAGNNLLGSIRFTDKSSVVCMDANPKLLSF